MLLDDLITKIFLYSLGIVLLLCILKILLMIWYKPSDIAFAFKNFFKITMDDLAKEGETRNKKWSLVRKRHEQLSLIINILFFLTVSLRILLLLLERN